MADVSRVHGPGGPAEPPGGKKTPSETQKFKELMRVQKTPEADPDEKKKRKRREEAEDDQLTGSGQPPAEKNAPIQTKTDDGGPLQGVSSKKGPLSYSSFEASPPSKVSTNFEGAEEEGEERQVFDETSYIESFPSAPSTSSEQPSFPKEETPSLPAAPQGPGAMGSPSQSASGRGVTGPSGEQQKKSGSGEKILPKPAEPVKQSVQFKPRTGKSGQEIPIEASEEDRKQFLQTFKKTRTSQPPATADEMEGQVQPGFLPSGPKENAALGEGKDKEKIPKIEAPPESAGQIDSGLSSQTPLPQTTETAAALPSYVHLSPQILEIFERMVGVMTIMTDAGMRETTMTLNNPQFAASVFFGAQIIIQEFSSAPMSYNVQFVGSPQATALFGRNVEELMAAFQGGNYNFRINRIDISLQSAEKPLFKRKESVGEEGEEENQGNEQ